MSSPFICRSVGVGGKFHREKAGARENSRWMCARWMCSEMFRLGEVKRKTESKTSAGLPETEISQSQRIQKNYFASISKSMKYITIQTV
jgi:hypothetical protein